MPELPEVETVRRGLAPVMEGANVEQLELRRADLRFPFPQRFRERIEGRRIVSLGRRAKYLLADLDSGEAVIMHLGMSGSFRIETKDHGGVVGEFHHERSRDAAHDHVVFHLRRPGPQGEEIRVVYNDPRRFGFMDIGKRAELESHPRLAGLGMEPGGNELDAAAIAALFAGKAAPVKAALLDQRLIAGLGNIYVCEALWQAGISPRRAAGSLVRANALPSSACGRLAEAIRDVIARAIEAGGSSLRDHRQADGSLGYFQHEFRVYGREGEKCPRPGCRGLVERIAQSGRSTFLCQVCQK
jgi:formamidopyrimidine-DNA glycosylase